MTSAGILAVLGLTLSSGGTGAGEHLLAGAQAFRDGHFDQALVEFRVAQGLGSPEAAAYAAASLVKLERPEEAVEAFGDVEAPGGDLLIDYYRALACYEARLYLCADRLLAAVGDRTGPRIGEQVAKLRASIAAALAHEPSHEAIDWYHARCRVEAEGGRKFLAAASCREAAMLAERRQDGYRRAEALASLARLAGPVQAGRKR